MRCFGKTRASVDTYDNVNTYLSAVLQQVNSEQGLALQCFGKTCFAVDTYVNAIRQ